MPTQSAMDSRLVIFDAAFAAVSVHTGTFFEGIL